ncbi:hypothetical protein BC832DRAFT_544610 [Gaertneriomyces semiglobifer]|nr:hypothetical protein BC832DRAFT_544610 [Gaertneriomyces semiglobifer]
MMKLSSMVVAGLCLALTASGLPAPQEEGVPSPGGDAPETATHTTTAFVEATATLPPAQVETPVPTPTQPVLPNTCRIAGCNGELCVPNTRDTVLSSCIWRPQYACYDQILPDPARCAWNATAKACAWRLTPGLQDCLAQYSSA